MRDARCPGHGVDYPWADDCPECVKDANRRGMHIRDYYERVRPALPGLARRAIGVERAIVDAVRDAGFPDDGPADGCARDRIAKLAGIVGMLAKRLPLDDQVALMDALMER